MTDDMQRARELDHRDLEFSAWPEPVIGGMHVGCPKGVKAVHKPTGITVICDTERSQHKNRDTCIRAIAAALRQAAVGEWQPIETAPDGRVLCFGPGWVTPLICYRDGETWIVLGIGECVGAPTHWMPLPAVPMLAAAPGRE